MKKSELRQNMIVETTGGNFGIVVLKDSTDENCIKFLYSPEWLSDHGCLYNSSSLVLLSLDDLDENLNCCYPATKEDAEIFDDVKEGDPLIAWQIIRVYKPSQVWERNNLQATCSGLMGDDIA